MPSTYVDNARALLAVSREQARLLTERALTAEQRVKILCSELQTLSAELLDVRSLVLCAETSGVNIRVSDHILELRQLFANIAQRKSKQAARVTVVIPVYEQSDYTLRCLRSIAINWSYSVNADIVLVDDCSPDGSGRQFIGIPAITVLFNGTNQGYLRSTNRGASMAKTPYVCFLNNDTEVLPGWLDYLVDAAQSDARVGAVGSKLIYPDGRLQEAGSIIWSDASGWNYGRGDDPTKTAYNYVRDVDYCSAASLLVRTELLRELGGFDERYAPAYYEDADLCFEIRRCGRRVIYEPRSEVIHYEGVSSGTDIASGIKQYQEVNRAAFAEKWSVELARQQIASPANVEAAMIRKSPRASILVIDTYVPMHDREAGSNRLFKLIKIFVELNYHVIFLPENQAVMEPYTSDLMRLGVEIMHWRERGITLDAALRAALPRTALAWICRPELCEKYVAIVRAHSSARILYDTIDLHYVRERRQAEIEQRIDDTWKATKERELSCARSVDATITVTTEERNELLGQDVGDVFVVPTIHDLAEHHAFGFDVRRGLLFIGGYNHTPNVDAVLWLCNEIMPIVWRSLPDVSLTLLGSSPSDAVRALQSDRVLVTGYVADVSPFFEECRIFVAPLRYGAGMKGKVGHALSYGLPVVTTQVGAEGYNLVHNVNCTIANDATAFAAAVIALYNDRERWTGYANRGRDVIASVGSAAVTVSVAAMLRAFIAEPGESQALRLPVIRADSVVLNSPEAATHV